MLGSPSFHPDVLCQGEGEKTTVQMSNDVVCMPKTEDDLLNFDAAVPLIPYTSPYKLKDPIIVLERCDKIWKTLRLIKNAQANRNYAQEESKCENVTSEVKNNGSYVEYQPVFGNSNEKLPNFQLSVKAKRKVYNCSICGKQFLQLQNLNRHCSTVHEIPLMTKKESVQENHKIPKGLKQDDGIDSQVTEKNKAAHVCKPKQLLVTKIENTRFVVHIQEDKKNGIPLSKCDDSKNEDDVSVENTYTQSKQGEENDILEYFKCLLCKRIVRYPETHILKYHKIVSRGTKIENFCARISSTSPVEKRSKKNTNFGIRGIHFKGTKRKRTTVYEARKRMHYDNDHNYCQSNTALLHTTSSFEKKDSTLAITCNDGMRKRFPSQSWDNVDDNCVNENNNEPFRNVCNCGRVFRSAHTLYVHRSKCKVQGDRDKDLTARHSSDRDSGIGINITIKKKNHSYEIKGKDTGDETTTMNDVDLNNCEASSDTSNYFSGESSEYSKDHSILKLEIADEDVVVDIEDDTSVQPCNTKDQLNAHKIDLDGKLDTKYICPCGNTYETENSFRNHMLEVHRLLLKCAYCKRTFNSITKVTNHVCSITGVPGEPYDSVLKIPCCYCNMEIDVKDMDAHKQSKHVDCKYPCYFCNKNFNVRKERERHMRTAHPQTRRCAVCYEMVTVVDGFIRHREYHSGRGWPCHKCFKAYKSKQSLDYHVSSVHYKNN